MLLKPTPHNKYSSFNFIILIGSTLLCRYFVADKRNFLMNIHLTMKGIKYDHKIYYVSNYVPNINYFPDEHFDHVIHFRDNYNYSDTVKKFNGRIEQYTYPPFSLPVDWQSYNISYGFIKNVHVSRSPSIIMPKGRFADTPFHWLPQIQGPTTGKVVYHFDFAMAPGHSFCDSFGHFHIDYFPSILIMPEVVIKTYKILNVPNLDFIHEALDIIGLPRENRIPPLKQGELAFCDIVIYPFNPMIHQRPQGFPQILIQKLYHKHFKLDEIKATRNCIINRRDTRIWKNANDLLAALKENYPQLIWEMVEDIHGLGESSKVYASIKFLMTPSGSNLFHCFFMHRGTVILTVEGTCHDWSSILSILACGIHHILFKSPLLIHKKGFPGFDVNVKEFVKAAGFAVRYITQGQFPEEELVF